MRPFTYYRTARNGPPISRGITSYLIRNTPGATGPALPRPSPFPAMSALGRFRRFTASDPATVGWVDIGQSPISTSGAATAAPGIQPGAPGAPGSSPQAAGRSFDPSIWAWGDGPCPACCRRSPRASSSPSTTARWPDPRASYTASGRPALMPAGWRMWCRHGGSVPARVAPSEQTTPAQSGYQRAARPRSRSFQSTAIAAALGVATLLRRRRCAPTRPAAQAGCAACLCLRPSASIDSRWSVRIASCRINR